MDELQSPALQDFLGEWLGNFLAQMAALCVVWLMAFVFGITALTATVGQIALVTVFVAFLITGWNWLIDGMRDPLDVYPPDMGPTGLADEHEQHRPPKG